MRFPGCTNPIIAPGTPFSDAAVVGQICYIYAASNDGPRGKPGLTAAERNSPDNLILMCGHHHPLVDKQWETYPADLLTAWKKTRGTVPARDDRGSEAARVDAANGLPASLF
jgi:hypothetical protein